MLAMQQTRKPLRRQERRESSATMLTPHLVSPIEGVSFSSPAKPVLDEIIGHDIANIQDHTYHVQR